MTYLKVCINLANLITCIMSKGKVSLIFFSTEVCCLQYLIIQRGLYDSIFRTTQRIFRKKYQAKKDNL